MDFLAIVKKFRAQYGTPIGAANTVKCLKDIAREINHQQGANIWGILKKGAGNNCGGYACDIICNSTTMEQFDCFIDSENAATPCWNKVNNPNWQDGIEIIPYDFSTSTDNGGETPIEVDITKIFEGIYAKFDELIAIEKEVRDAIKSGMTIKLRF